MTTDQLYVVGIGSSAGGLPALQSFVKNVQPNDKTAFAIVQHLPGSHQSQLASILARESTVPVVEIADGTTIDAGKIYVMPAGYKLRLDNNIFKLDPREESETINRAINYFFMSLAKAKKSLAFGVILSGTGTDGVEGVKEIEKEGGIVLVQDPATAQFDGMPVNTIHNDHPDYVLEPGDMPSLIKELQQNRQSHEGSRRRY